MRRTGRTGCRAADAPVVGVDVTPDTVACEQRASDAGVRPMDHHLTRPMQLQVLGELSGAAPDAGYLSRHVDVSVRCVRPERGRT